MAKNRYIGEYPVIGIRPIIDGRRGPMQLRESLEDQVMAMAAELVIVEADNRVRSGSIRPEDVMTPGIVVDYIVEGGDEL